MSAPGTREEALGKTRIAVIMPAKNEEETIGVALRSLLDQTHKLDQIIVVLGDCKDNTPRIASAYALKHREIKIVHKLESPIINSTYETMTFEFTITLIDSNQTLYHNYPVIIVDENFFNKDGRFSQMEKTISGLESELESVRAQLSRYTTLLLITTAVCLFIGVKLVIERIVSLIYVFKGRRR